MKNNIFEISKSRSVLNISETEYLKDCAPGINQNQIDQLDQKLGQQALDNSAMFAVVAFATTASILGHSALQAQEVIMPLITQTNDSLLRVSSLTANTAATIGTPLVFAAGAFKATGEIVYNTIAKPIARRKLIKDLNMGLKSEGIQPLK